MRRPGFSSLACLRVTMANSRIMGAAEGTIIPTIITHHINPIRIKVVRDQPLMVWVMVWPMLAICPPIRAMPIRRISPAAMSSARTTR